MDRTRGAVLGRLVQVEAGLAELEQGIIMRLEEQEFLPCTNYCTTVPAECKLPQRELDCV